MASLGSAVTCGEASFLPEETGTDCECDAWHWAQKKNTFDILLVYCQFWLDACFLNGGEGVLDNKAAGNVY